MEWTKRSGCEKLNILYPHNGEMCEMTLSLVRVHINIQTRVPGHIACRRYVCEAIRYVRNNKKKTSDRPMNFTAVRSWAASLFAVPWSTSVVRGYASAEWASRVWTSRFVSARWNQKVFFSFLPLNMMTISLINYPILWAPFYLYCVCALGMCMCSPEHTIQYHRRPVFYAQSK